MIAFFGSHLTTSAMIRSKPEAFLNGYLLLTHITSFGVSLTGREAGSRELNKILPIYLVI